MGTAEELDQYKGKEMQESVQHFGVITGFGGSQTRIVWELLVHRTGDCFDEGESAHDDVDHSQMISQELSMLTLFRNKCGNVGIKKNRLTLSPR